jgi:hypothetical protein
VTPDSGKQAFVSGLAFLVMVTIIAIVVLAAGCGLGAAPGVAGDYATELRQEDGGIESGELVLTAAGSNLAGRWSTDAGTVDVAGELLEHGHRVQLRLGADLVVVGLVTPAAIDGLFHGPDGYARFAAVKVGARTGKSLPPGEAGPPPPPRP